MRPNGSKRRGFAVGDPARQSRDGDGKTSAPVGPMTGCAVSPQAKCDRMGASAGVLPLGTRRGGAVTGTAKQRCGVAKPWPRSGQPHRVVSRSEMPRALLRGKPKRWGR
ncbi:hypothetical protein, partial [Ruthenibacterium lactatiformans]|uniref:hypothetical protein n=1 Tax=Ruthenibacterium lactatiformans TaxID=1550024 RepID=UPI002671E8A1